MNLCGNAPVTEEMLTGSAPDTWMPDQFPQPSLSRRYPVRPLDQIATLAQLKLRIEDGNQDRTTKMIWFHTWRLHGIAEDIPEGYRTVMKPRRDWLAAEDPAYVDYVSEIRRQHVKVHCRV